MANKPRVRLNGRFSAGTKVQLVTRNTDWYNGVGTVVDTATTDSDGITEFSKVDEGALYWAVAKFDGEDVRAVKVTGKCPPEAKERVERPSAAEAQPYGAPEAKAEEPLAKKDVPDEPQPGLRQADVPEGVLQRSSTPLGEATIIPKGEISPTPGQSDVPANVVQRSSTEEGEAAVKPKDDVSPSQKQEDHDDTLQRSNTPHGEAVLKPEPGEWKKPDPTPASEATAKTSQVKPKAEPAQSAKDVENPDKALAGAKVEKKGRK